MVVASLAPLIKAFVAWSLVVAEIVDPNPNPNPYRSLVVAEVVDFKVFLDETAKVTLDCVCGQSHSHG